MTPTWMKTTVSKASQRLSTIHYKSQHISNWTFLHLLDVRACVRVCLSIDDLRIKNHLALFVAKLLSAKGTFPITFSSSAVRESVEFNARISSGMLSSLPRRRRIEFRTFLPQCRTDRSIKLFSWSVCIRFIQLGFIWILIDEKEKKINVFSDRFKRSAPTNDEWRDHSYIYQNEKKNEFIIRSRQEVSVCVTPRWIPVCSLFCLRQHRADR